MANGFRTQQRRVDYVGEPNISLHAQSNQSGPILTIRGAGVEAQSSVLHPSCHFRYRLQAFILYIQSLKAVAGHSCRASDRSAESDAGRLRRFGGLLYLETWGEDLRTR